VTSYNVEFPRRELPRLYRHQPEKYKPSLAPMDTVPLYRALYVNHGAKPARSCRPPPVPPVTAPISESTEHRDNYVGDLSEVCPAVQLLQRVPGCVVPAGTAGGEGEGPKRRVSRSLGRFRYFDRDDAGHEWYTFEQSRTPGPECIVYNPSRYVRGDSVEAAAARQAAARAMTWKPAQPTSLPTIVA